FRLSMMGLTSFAGSLLVLYAGLCLAERFGKVNTVALAETQATLLNGAVATLTLTGGAGQFLTDPRRKAAKRLKEKKPPTARRRQDDPPEPKRGWLSLPANVFRRAG